MDFAPTNHLSLCSGYGGIDLGLRQAIPDLRTIAYAEIEAFACENLLARMEGGSLDAAPIWPDIKTFPWKSFSGRVDILSGGYPCQPFSAAGKRLGTDDPRHLWPFIAAGIRILRPAFCFFENVEGHISLGLREVVGELESMGYKVSWGIFSAREVGAPHQRKRVFILAHSRGAGLQRHWGFEQIGLAQGRTIKAEYIASKSGFGIQTIGNKGWPSRPGELQHKWEPPRVVANDHRAHARHGEQRPERTLGDLSGGCGEGVANFASGRTNAGQQFCGEECGQGRALPLESDDSGEHMGTEQRQTQPPLGGDADGSASGMDYAELCVTCDNRTDELRLLGNGVVPATATLAFKTLLDELLK